MDTPALTSMEVFLSAGSVAIVMEPSTKDR